MWFLNRFIESAVKIYKRYSAVLIILLRFILIFWIVSVLLRWFRRLGTSGGKSTPVDIGNNANAPVNLGQSGSIDDAEFEEIDKK